MARRPERPAPEALASYRAKRSPGRTPEPFSAAGTARARLFVVQKHAATRTHYDLRLELNGVLLSWAVPKGISLDPADKRLAVQVEEHPVDYADFEGVIPPGNYGAGPVIVWDRGVWVAVEDFELGLAKGKLLFELHGYKLRGRFTLFRTKGAERDWLLVKKLDAHARVDRPPPDSSILSGLTVEELGRGVRPGERLGQELARLGAPRAAARPADLAPMLAETADEPFDRAGWLFELKYDGYRVLAARRDGEATLRLRRGHDATATFPEIALAVRSLPYQDLVLDGELVVLDATSRPSFERLQRRVGLRRGADIQRATVELPATLFVFDLLSAEGFDLRPLPLLERKRLLEPLLPPAGPLRYAEHIERRGKTMYAEVARLGFEGLVAKKADAPYRAGRRSADWLKIRVDRAADLVVVGYSAPARGRSAFGALHLATHENGELVYAGRVGTGFTERQLPAIRARLEPHRVPVPPCSGAVPQGSSETWVAPQLVCEVRYKEWTSAGLLRHPVFLRLKDDVPVAACVRPGAAFRPDDPPAPPADEDSEPPAARTLSLTNLDKVFWPEDGLTKGDLIAYYRRVAPFMLPYLKDRPVVLTRFPDGIHGKSFFQKDAPGYIPAWIRTATMWSEHAQREIGYFVCEDETTLVYLANLATIPLHVWSSRLASLQRPDWCILDLDPKTAPFAHVVQVARAIRDLCRTLELPAFVKTSGGSGLHVLLPLGEQCTYEQSRQLGELLARVIVGRLPEVATIVRAVPAREGRVYIDFLQNGHGRLLVAPYSVRPLPGAPVSTPLDWSEVGPRLTPGKFTIRTAPRRFEARAADPLLRVLAARPDLPAVLERLLEVVQKP